MEDQVRIYDSAAEEEARRESARSILNAYIQSRIAFYDGTGSSSMTYERLLGKDLQFMLCVVLKPLKTMRVRLSTQSNLQAKRRQWVPVGRS